MTGPKIKKNPQERIARSFQVTRESARRLKHVAVIEDRAQWEVMQDALDMYIYNKEYNVDG